MPRLNVYVDEDLAPLIERWRGRVNLSELCTDSLRDSLLALESGRSPGQLLRRLFASGSQLEHELADAFGLNRVVVSSLTGDDARENVAPVAATLLDGLLSDGVALAMGGGRQMWSVVRNLRPRSVRTEISAVGFGQVDPHVLHAHPNTLVTLLWLLYSPRAKAHLVGATGFDSAWDANQAESGELQRIIAGSCAPFDRTSSFADLLGDDSTRRLADVNAQCDFLGAFLDADGAIVDVQNTRHQSMLTGSALQAHARRDDTVVLLAAAGATKLNSIRSTLNAHLCNTLVTDEITARALISRR